MSRVPPEHERQHRQSEDEQLQDPSDRETVTLDRDPDRDVPYFQEIASVLDEVINIARDQLEHPISAEVETWEDGEFKITVDHAEGGGGRYYWRSVVRYHNDQEVVEGFYLREDREGDDGELLHKEELKTIPDPLANNNANQTKPETVGEP